MDSPLRRALLALANRQSLSEDQTAEVFGVVMAGEATPAQIGGLLMGLRAKGETADELAGATRALRGGAVNEFVPTDWHGRSSSPRRYFVRSMHVVSVLASSGDLVFGLTSGAN